MRPVLEEDSDENTAGLAPALQLLTSASWLSLKEAGLVIGIIARHIPLLREMA